MQNTKQCLPFYCRISYTNATHHPDAFCTDRSGPVWHCPAPLCFLILGDRATTVLSERGLRVSHICPSFSLSPLLPSLSRGQSRALVCEISGWRAEALQGISYANGLKGKTQCHLVFDTHIPDRPQPSCTIRSFGQERQKCLMIACFGISTCPGLS